MDVQKQNGSNGHAKTTEPVESPATQSVEVQVFEVPAAVFQQMVGAIGQMPWESVHQLMNTILRLNLQPKTTTVEVPKQEANQG